jgi:endonuclease-3
MLDFENPLQLLIATILAAQCTDKKVNEVTPALFKKYPSAQAFANAKPAELEKMVRQTGFFRQKAKSIVNACRDIVEKHGGEVPDTMEELTDLSGVGRKTANVLLGAAFDQPAIIVDTHFKRLTNRMGLTEESDPDKIEFDVRALLPKKEWTAFSHRITFHGRAVCAARKPKCAECAVAKLCPSAFSFD